MFKLDTFKLTRKLTSRHAAAFGALVIGVVGFSAAAGAATPLPLFLHRAADRIGAAAGAGCSFRR
jgi:hypothetical protein